MFLPSRGSCSQTPMMMYSWMSGPSSLGAQPGTLWGVHPWGGCPLTVSFRDVPETGFHAVTVHVCALCSTWLGGSDSTQGTVDSIGHMVTLVVIWRNNHRTDSGTHRSLCETHLSRNSADRPISTGPCSGGQSGVWGVSETNISAEPVSSSP